MEIIKQLSPEWFDARKGRITGSICGAILGLSPFLTRYGAMRSMVRDALGAEREFIGNPATMWGQAMEAQARGDYEMDTGLTAMDAPFVPFEDWLGASPDAYVNDDGLVEFKCPFGIRKDLKPVFKQLNEMPHYEAQCQIELFVTKRAWLDFYQWTPYGFSMESVRPNQEWIYQNIPVLRQFHAEFLHEVENNADEYLGQIRPSVDTPEAHKMLEEYDQLSEAISKAEERKKELLCEIVTLAGGKNSYVAGRKVTKIEKAGSISFAKAFKTLMPDANLAPYTGKPSSYWKLS